MSTALADVFAQALELPEQERHELIDMLCASLEPPEPSPEEQSEIDASWMAVIKRRSQEIKEGRAKLVPWSEMQALLRRHQGQ